MQRTILHSDCNGFYASVACLYNPEIRNKPVVVGGDVEARHGIALAANQIAKKLYKVKTGEVLWQIKQRCPNLIVVKPDYKLYLKYAKLTREIYSQYTDQVEPFGLDEAFLDVSGSYGLFGGGQKIANEIRERIKRELGITVSIGVSYNKVFAKLGSDMKKPDATTIITKEDYKQKVWPLPASDLLYVGRATTARLQKYGIYTIGELANCNKDYLHRWFGVNGDMLWRYANGDDNSVVRKFDDAMNDDEGIKSIGNSTTTPRDLLNADDVKVTVMLLSESVAARLREHKRLCKTVSLWLRDNKLNSFERQCKVKEPTQLAVEISETAMKLFALSYGSLGNPHSTLLPLRSIGVRTGDLIREDDVTQLSLFPEERKRHDLMSLEHVMDTVRERYGHNVISRGMMMVDRGLSKTNPKDDHIMTFPGGS